MKETKHTAGDDLPDTIAKVEALEASIDLSGVPQPDAAAFHRKLEALRPGKLSVMADPILAGKHPYHDARYIVRGNPAVEKFPVDGDDEWRFESQASSIICVMRDIEDQKEMAVLFAAAPKLLIENARLRSALTRIACHTDALSTSVATEIARAALALAEGSNP